MVQYNGADWYDVDIGTIKGEFHLTDITELLTELQKYEKIESIRSNLEKEYLHGWEDCEKNLKEK